MNGGCTTFVAQIIIQKIRQDYEIIGYPRLVRLNPNIPWKTRGNGALCIHVGQTKGSIRRKIGEISGKAVFCSTSIVTEFDKNQQKNLASIVKKTVEIQARVDDENTNPGYVLLSERPHSEFYWKAVTTIVSLDEVISLLEKHHAIYAGYKNRRGLIGATAAICWEPKDRTYELITYRPHHQWGTKRHVDALSVQHIDAKYKSTFDNYDRKNHYNRIVPNSPCPILYGIRGNNADDLVTAFEEVKSEPMDSWLVFETNQGTDDHLQRKSIEQIRPFESVIVRGIVIENPFTIQGGHVFFKINDKSGTITCAAYEPTKEFRQIIRGLSNGDLVEVYGGVREYPLTINLEKIFIQQLAQVTEKIENPVCPQCKKHMKSKGTHQGYKCRNCGTINSEPVLQKKPRSIIPGFYEVPICARRHLSKSLKRMTKKSIEAAIGISDIP